MEKYIWKNYDIQLDKKDGRGSRIDHLTTERDEFISRDVADE